jgi:hypothetical protein
VDNDFRVCTYFVPVCLRCRSVFFFHVFGEGVATNFFFGSQYMKAEYIR